jgi:hypothetical protein
MQGMGAQPTERWMVLMANETHEPQEITLPNGEYATNCTHCDGIEWPCEAMKGNAEEPK